MELTSANTANAEVEKGGFNASDTQIRFFPREWSCALSDPTYAFPYKFVGSSLSITNGNTVIVFEPVVAAPATSFAVTTGCNQTGTFVPSPLAPVGNYDQPAADLDDPRRTSVAEAMRWLEQHATKKTRDGMARFGIPSTNALGVTVGDMRKYAKTIGKDHALAERLWKTGVYEGRFMAAFVDDPAAVMPAQMENGRGTSTTGRSATPSASRCSIARPTPGRRCTRGPARARSSSAAGRSRCSGR